jgi:hypothetical protein
MPENIAIRPEFQAFRLNDHGKQLAHAASEIFTEALNKLDGLLGDQQGRERALMVTTLQQAAFWARRALSVQPSNQQPK